MTQKPETAKTSEETRFKESVVEILNNQTHETQPLKLEISVSLGLFGETLLLHNGEHTIEITPDGPTGQFLLAALHKLHQKSKDHIAKTKEQNKYKKLQRKTQETTVASKPLPKLVISKYIPAPGGNGKVSVAVRTEAQKEKKPEKQILNLDLFL